MILDQKLFPMDHAKPKSLDPEQWCTEGARSFVIAFVVCCWIFLGSACFHFATGCTPISSSQRCFVQMLRTEPAQAQNVKHMTYITWPIAIKHLKGKKDRQHHQHRSQFHPISVLFACNPKTLSLWGCKAYESDNVRLQMACRGSSHIEISRQFDYNLIDLHITGVNDFNLEFELAAEVG